MSSHLNYLGAKKCCATNLAKTVIGPQGPQGAGGPIGPYGNQGPTGTQGPRGATGACCRGPPGATGAPGPAGGAQGETGSTGPQGYQGETGSTGEQGSTGPQGYQGETGSTGPQGYQGETGAQGLIGSTGAGGALGYWGAFWSTQTQLNIDLSTPKAMTLNNTDPDSNGVSIVANSQITFSNAGVYNIQFSAQIQDTTSGGGGSQIIEIWFSKNGSPIPDSNTSLTTDNQNSYVVAAWNFMLKLNAGDYVEIFWYSTDTGIQLSAVSPVTTGPDIPSVIVTAQQVMYTQLGATGATGPQGVTGPQGATGITPWNSTNYIGVTGPGYTGIGYTGDVMIFGGLYVSGGIDPTYLALEPQNTNFNLPSGLKGICVAGTSLKTTNQIFQQLNTSSSYNAVNGYYALSKDAYPSLNPSSVGVKATSTWDYRTINKTGINNSVCWSPELGIFVSVGSVTNGITYSYDGINWTSANSGIILTNCSSSGTTITCDSTAGLFTGFSIGILSGTGDVSGSIASITNATQFVVSSAPTIALSGATLVANNTNQSVCWSPQLRLFVAVAGFGANGRKVQTSPDGINWTFRNGIALSLTGCSGSGTITTTDPLTTSILERFLFISSSDFGVSVANNPKIQTIPSSTTFTITTGASVTIATTATLYFDNNWSGVCWSAELGLFVAVGGGNEGLARQRVIMYSSDGINWSVGSFSTPNIYYWNFPSVCWSPQLSLFVGVSNRATASSTGGENRVFTSPDGITWTQPDNPNIYSYNSLSICWSPSLGRLVSVGSSGVKPPYTTNVGAGTCCMYSDNGTTWNTIILGVLLTNCNVVTNTTTSATISCDSVSQLETGMFVNVYSGTGEIKNGAIIQSIDAGLNQFNIVVSSATLIITNLSNTTLFAGRQNQEVVWSPQLELFVATAVTGVKRIATSPNGIDWTFVNVGIPITNCNIVSGTTISCDDTSKLQEGMTLGLLTGGGVMTTATGGAITISTITGLTTFTTSTAITGLSNTTLYANNNWNSVAWSDELGLYCAVGGGGTTNRYLTSSLKGRPPTALNVFDSSFNNIDSSGNWTLKSKSIFSDENITIDPSNNLIIDGNLDMSLNNITRVSNITNTSNITIDPSNTLIVAGDLDMSLNNITKVNTIDALTSLTITDTAYNAILLSNELNISDDTGENMGLTYIDLRIQDAIGNATVLDKTSLTITDGTNTTTLNSTSLIGSSSLTLTTNSFNRLVIDSDGAWTINNSTGTSGQYLTSAGAGSTPTWTTFDPYFAEYINTGNQSLTALTATDLSLNTIVYENGITINGSVISFNKAGTYKVGVSLLAEESGGSGADLFFSFTDNVGVIANSSSVFQISGNGEKTLGYAEILYTATASSTIKCVVYTVSTGVITLTSYSSPDPKIAASPAVIMTIYQIN
jgi:hypothetical protein